MRDAVKAYYGETLQSSTDLKSDACCEISAPAPHIQAALANIHDAVASRYYGCGLVAPEGLDGKTILDLGCGTGRDVYLLAQLAGENGQVIGVDMTDEQLAIAREYEAWHAGRFGFAQPNTQFQKGYIESLGELDLALGSVDVVVSNCVINLAMDKPAVFAGVRRLLKADGAMHFADVYAEAPIPEALRTDPVLYGECLAGALSWTDFLTIAKETGFAAPRVVDHRPLEVQDAALLEKLDGLKFQSVTVELVPASVPGEGWDVEITDPFAPLPCCG